MPDLSFLGQAPYPALDHPILDMIVEHALASIDGGEDLRAAILYATVNAWSEGHIEGEERCGGCSYRGPAGEHAQRLRAEAHATAEAGRHRRAGRPAERS